MAYETKKDQRGYIEFRDLIFDQIGGNVEVLERVTDVARLYPLKPKDNLIILCSHGSMSLRLSGTTFEASTGDVLICPPNVKLSDAVFSENFECRIIRISDHLVQTLLRDKADVWHHAVYVNQLNILQMPETCKEEFGFYFSLISCKVNQVNSGAPCEMLLALLRAFLLEISSFLETEHDIVKEHKLSQGKVLFNRFLNILSNSDIKRQPITFYASQLAITPKYLTMLCQKYSDKTASEWVIQYTTEEIRFYLKSSDLSIKEISAKLGFSNMSHFGSYVRKHLGMSPSEFRYNKK